MMAFKSGDLVQLKGGGQKMTVIGEDEAAQTVDCRWWPLGSNAGTARAFPAGDLVKVERPDFSQAVRRKEIAYPDTGASDAGQTQEFGYANWKGLAPFNSKIGE